MAMLAMQKAQLAGARLPVARAMPRLSTVRRSVRVAASASREEQVTPAAFLRLETRISVAQMQQV